MLWDIQLDAEVGFYSKGNRNPPARLGHVTRLCDVVN